MRPAMPVFSAALFSASRADLAGQAQGSASHFLQQTSRMLLMHRRWQASRDCCVPGASCATSFGPVMSRGCVHSTRGGKLVIGPRDTRSAASLCALFHFSAGAGHERIFPFWVRHGVSRPCSRIFQRCAPAPEYFHAMCTTWLQVQCGTWNAISRALFQRGFIWVGCGLSLSLHRYEMNPIPAR